MANRSEKTEYGSMRARTVEEQEAALERQLLLDGLRDCFHLLGQLTVQGRTGSGRYAHYLQIVRENTGALNDQQIGLLEMYSGFHENTRGEAGPVRGVDILPMQPVAEEPTSAEPLPAQVSGM